MYGTIAGIGLSAGGKGKAINAPSSEGQATAVRRALAKAGAGPDEVGCVIAHATGTRAGDAAEFRGLAQAYAEASGPLPVTSNKSLVGHTGWPAGVVSVIHLLLALRHERIPAQYRFTAAPDAFAPDATPLTVPGRPVPWPADPDGPARLGAVSAFGFGGTNAHVLVREHRRHSTAPGGPTTAAEHDDVVVVGWSAHLPGTRDMDDVRAWAAGRSTPPLSFGDSYPPPAPSEFRRLAQARGIHRTLSGLRERLGARYAAKWRSGGLEHLTGPRPWRHRLPARKGGGPIRLQDHPVAPSACAVGGGCPGGAGGRPGHHAGRERGVSPERAGCRPPSPLG
ncbi:hypothetical protein [Streptomyces sp. NPDC047061]|uniref:hypothetical protein n=1 Tax=Streptomyces sp. NPDC047061 TaxID=3154605 RepID=UPI003410FE27